MNTPFELHVDDYMRLPIDVRAAVNEWAEGEGLWGVEGGHLIRSFRLGEGFIDAECIVEPPHAIDGEVVTERRRIPVGTLPPAELFRGIADA
jgi:hypothetical protein